MNISGLQRELNTTFRDFYKIRLFYNKKGIFSASQGERKELLRSSKTKLKKYHKSWNKQTSVPVFPPGSLHVSVCTEQPGSAMEYLGLEVKQEP